MTIARSIARPIASPIASRTPIIGGGGGGYSPIDLPGLLGWYDASNSESIVGNSEWASSSGSGLPFTQADVSKQFTYTPTGFNGLPCWETAVGKWMDLIDGTQVFTGGFGFYAVYEKFGANAGFDCVYTRFRLIDQYNNDRLQGVGGPSSFNFRTAGQHVFSQEADVSIGQFIERVSDKTVFMDDTQSIPTSGNLLTGNVTLNSRSSDYFTSGINRIAEFLIFNRMLNASERMELLSYLHEKWSVSRPIYPVNIVCHGDSITLGVVFPAQTQNTFGRRLQTNYTNNAVTIRGINGQGFNYVWGSSGSANNLIQDAASWVDPLHSVGEQNYLVLFAGTNDITLGGSTAVGTYAALKTYVLDRINAGWAPEDIYVCTMLPRNSVESQRVDFNTAIVNDADNIGYSLVRLDLNANIGAAGSNTNTTYYNADAIHPNAAGHLEIYNEIVAAIGL